MSIWLVVAIVATYDCPSYMGLKLFSKAPAVVKEIVCSVDRQAELRHFTDIESALAATAPGQRRYQFVRERGKIWKREPAIKWVPQEG